MIDIGTGKFLQPEISACIQQGHIDMGVELGNERHEQGAVEPAFI